MYAALMARSLRQAGKRETTGQARTIKRFLSVSVKSTVSDVISVLPRKTKSVRRAKRSLADSSLAATTPCRLKPESSSVNQSGH